MFGCSDVGSFGPDVCARMSVSYSDATNVCARMSDVDSYSDQRIVWEPNAFMSTCVPFRGHV